MSKKKKKSKKNYTFAQQRAMLLTPCKTKDQLQRWIKYHLGLHLPDQTVSRYADSNPFDIIWELYEICVLKNNTQNIEEILCVAGRGSGKTLGMAIFELLCILHDQRDAVHIGAIMNQADRCYNYMKQFMYNKKLKPILMPPKIPEDQRILEKANMSKSIFNIGHDKVTLEVIPCTLKACLTINQKVYMHDGGIKAAGDVIKGEKLQSPLGPVTILENKIVEKECVEIEFDDGSVFRGTEDHEVMTNKGWVKLKDLTEKHDILQGRKCSSCGVKKLKNSFYKNKSAKDGLRSVCKDCDLSYKKRQHKKKYAKKPSKKCEQCGKVIGHRSTSMLCKKHREEKYRRDNEFVRKFKEAQKRSYDKKKEYYISKSKRWYARNKDRKRESVQHYREKYKKWYNDYQATYREVNKEKLREYSRKKDNHRYKNDVFYFLKKKIRNRTNDAIRAQLANKPCSFTESLGCDPEKLIMHIESRFQPGMSWGNRHKWHVDHIKPLSSFNLSDPEEFKKACHYTNLQPLWIKDNILKSDKYESQE